MNMMTNSNLPATTTSAQRTLVASESSDLVTMTVAGQVFGIPVLQVQDVLKPQRITRIPLAPPEIAGSLNLRGRIVTVIDVRTRLGLPAFSEDQKRMSIVVEHKGELYSLMVDQIGEVLNLPNASFEHNPSTLDKRWREIAQGIYRLEQTLLVVLDVARLLNFMTAEDSV